jgi:hypothetical protein
LDLIISRCESTLVTDVKIDTFISDHAAVLCNLRIDKPKHPKKEITFRKYRSVDVSLLGTDIQKCSLVTSPSSTMDELSHQYNLVLGDIMNKHAPEKTKFLVQRQEIPWYNDAVRSTKQNLRQIERTWRKSGLEVHKQMFCAQRTIWRQEIIRAKAEYYSSKVADCQNDTKQLFKTMNGLLQKSSKPVLPSHTSKQLLANKFGEFFSSKIQNIRTNLESVRDVSDSSGEFEIKRSYSNQFDNFLPASEAEIKKIILKAPKKSCQLDPLPTWMLCKISDVLVPVLTKMINFSMTSGNVPSDMKSALVTPLIKKPSLDREILKNYRPVSNLSYASKLLERVVASRLQDHLREQDICEPLQSAYKAGHSVETAILRVHNDILQAIDRQEIVLLVLLDLSAAFDTIDHDFLLQRMSTIGIGGSVLQWFKSYLAERTQSVCIDGVKSKKFSIKYGVPQGSVLGPLLFSVYILPLGDIIRRYNIFFHIYADDTQLYISFRPGVDTSKCVAQLEKCISEIRSWMLDNFLCLNDEKSEFLVIGTKQQREKLNIASIKFGKCEVVTASKARNLGVIFDEAFNLDSHVKQLCKSTNYYLRSVGKIRKFLTDNATEQVIHGLITSRLDMCNSVLHGLPSCALEKLQRIQNNAARVLVKCKKYDRITPVLKKLHWLPIRQRIVFKILLLTYKALNDGSPSYIRDLLQEKTSVRTLRSNAKKLLKIPITKLSMCKNRAFSCVAPSLWNELPDHIKLCDSVNSFKNQLKTHLFKLSYG